MNEKLSWDQIRAKYPDEYVVIVDVDMDKSTTTLLGGTVMNHGKDKAEMISYLGALKARSGACRWTGKIHGRVQTFVKADSR
jgi:hypothetical protein